MNRSSPRDSNRCGSRHADGNAGVFGAIFEAARDSAGVQVGELLDQVKSEGGAFVDSRKGLVAEQFTNVGGAIRRAADKLHDTDSAFIAAHVDRAADKVEEIGRYIEENDLPEVIEDASVIARRQPVIFGTGMFIVGLLAARFVKAGQQERLTSAAGKSRKR